MSVHAEDVQATRLLLEDVCSDIVRFLHGGLDGAAMNVVHVDREWPLGEHRFADLRVEPPGDEPPYFVEVKYGYSRMVIAQHLARKYGALDASTAKGATYLVIVVESHDDVDLEAMRTALPAFLKLEVWDLPRLRELTQAQMGFSFGSLEHAELISVRGRIDEAKERLAFGDRPSADYAEAALRQSLLWHFGVWHVAELGGRTVRNVHQLVPAGMYENVIAVFADISGFSRLVRETPDPAIVRHELTNFYGKARYQVINAGGMVDQFVGDALVALFGVPEGRDGYVEAAARTALRLLEIGQSVAYDWQRHLDAVQPHVGVHVGMSMGRAQLVHLRSLDPSRTTVIGDSINLAARLLAVAGCDQVIVSNVLGQQLMEAGFNLVEREPVEAKNIGTIQAWELEPRA